MILVRAQRALAIVATVLPELAPFAHRARVRESTKTLTAGVFRSGRILVNPSFLAALTDAELVFVLAHELMHLLLRTHERAEGADARAFNIAHDLVINDMLKGRLGMDPPQAGVWIEGAAHRSAEELLGTVHESFADRDALLDDVLADELDEERRGGNDGLGLGGTWRERRVRSERERISPYLAARVEQRLPSSRLGPPSAAAGTRRVPGLAAWLARTGASATERQRSWGRASRRDPLLRPGRAARGATVGVILDTSTSMMAEMEKALAALRGVLADVVGGVRLLEHDGLVRRDRVVEDWRPDAEVACGGDHEMIVLEEPCVDCKVRHAYRIAGADTDLAPAFARLEAAPEIEAVVVLTDGYVVPPKRTRKPLFWVLTGEPDEPLLPAGARTAVLD